MGATNIRITVRNAGDVSCAERGLITPAQIRSVELTALVDTGAMKFLVIGEETRDKLGLEDREGHPVRVAGGAVIKARLAGPVEIQWKNRRLNCDATVLPGQQQTLFGVLSLEALDLMVNPVDNSVVGAHGDQLMGIIM